MSVSHFLGLSSIPKATFYEGLERVWEKLGKKHPALFGIGGQKFWSLEFFIYFLYSSAILLIYKNFRGGCNLGIGC